MRFVLAAIALMWALLVPAAVQADPADIAAASRSVVRVVLIDQTDGQVALIGYGSGFAVTPDLIVTNAHVVAPLAGNPTMRVGVVPPQGKSGYFAKVVAYSPGNDLALLKLTEAGTLVPATLYAGPVDDGADVYAIGYPGNVDMAQGLSMADLMAPTTPVKTRGSVSAGRTSKSFDTILHTAPIGSGNSGGPLLDLCGRVIGANSFGTASANTTDSPFYFAVSMREITRFLHDAGVTARISGEPCRSLADLDRADAERLAQARALTDQQARDAAAHRDAALEAATRQAELEVIASRENHLALAGFALLLALVAAGAAVWFAQQGRPRERSAALAAAAVLVIAAFVAWLTRPAISAIDDRAHELVAKAQPSEPAAVPSPGASESNLICVFDPPRSRVTVSDTADVPLDWRADGCVNGRTQYGLAGGTWSRILVPGSEDTVSIANFDPASQTYRTERYLLDQETMQKLRANRAKFKAPSCGADPPAVQAFGEAQQAMRALLPASPNERLVYACRPAAPGPKGPPQIP
ncbi:MAG: trypsin-like peptidase domain-containing protein [Novosphingobium sp.]|nr:trypsin-like peptidase domain-containing protein [Novosphingobium sp.]